MYANDARKTGQENPKRLEIDIADAEIVRAAFDAFLVEGRQVDALRTLRTVDPSRDWSLDAARRLLIRRLYIGEHRLGQAVNPNFVTPIISRSDFDRAQELLATPKRPSTDLRGAGYQGRGEGRFPLRGMVRCGYCDCLLTPATATGSAGKILYYECSHFRKAGKDHPCPVRRVNADHLLAYLLSEVRRCAKHPTRLATILRASAAADQYTQRGTEARVRLKTIAKIKREKIGRIERLKLAIETADLPPVAIKDTWGRIIELETDLTALEKEAEELQSVRSLRMPPADSVAALWSQAIELWEDIAEEDRHTFMSSLVEEIVMDSPRTGRARLVVDRRLPKQNKTREIVIPHKSPP